MIKSSVWNPRSGFIAIVVACRNKASLLSRPLHDVASVGFRSPIVKSNAYKHLLCSALAAEKEGGCCCCCRWEEMFSACATPPQQLSLTPIINMALASRDTKSVLTASCETHGSCYGSSQARCWAAHKGADAAGPRVVPPVDSVLITRFDIFAFCWHATSEYETDARPGQSSGPVYENVDLNMSASQDFLRSKQIMGVWASRALCKLPRSLIQKHTNQLFSWFLT